MQRHFVRRHGMKPLALVLSGSLVLPTLVGCGGQPATQQAAPPPGFNSGSGGNAQPRTGMSTRNKVILLAGAAALYYIYNKRKNSQQQGAQGKYFRSEANGRIYYRDLKTGKFQYVSPPTQPIQVPAEELAGMQGLQRYQGYNNNRSGQSFGGYGAGNANYNDAVPAQY
jgi:hypothetical protein